MKRKTKSVPKAKKRVRSQRNSSPAVLLKRRLDFIQKRYLDPEKYGTNSNSQEAQLKKYRPELWGDIPVGTDAEATSPSRFNRQSDLARYLQEQFRTRLKITITPVTINSWRAGQRLQPVIVDGKSLRPPSFPAKDASGTYWDAAECVAWVERWIVPIHGNSQPQANGATPAAGTDLQQIEEDHKIWKIRLERDREEGRYKPVDEFLKWIDRLRECFKTSLVTELEGTLQRELQPIIDSLAVGDDVKAVTRVKMQEAGQRAVDNMLKAWAREVGAIGKETQAGTVSASAGAVVTSD